MAITDGVYDYVDTETERELTVTVMEHGGTTVGLDGDVTPTERSNIEQAVREAGIDLEQHHPESTLGTVVMKNESVVAFDPRDSIPVDQ